MSVSVKICGLTSVATVDAAVAAGADAIGLVLAPSPRQVEGALARRLFERIPPTVERIAVVARPAAGELREIARLPFDGVQAEADACAGLALDERAFRVPSFRDHPELEARLRHFLRNRTASRPSPNGWAGGCGREPAGKGPASSRSMPSYRSGASAPGHLSLPDASRGRSLRGAFLLDGPRGGGRGVPPRRHQAHVAARLGRLVLAGGLRPDTVAEAIRTVRPFAVDVSSGVESAPGVKDPELIHAFLDAVRSVPLTQAAT